MQVIIPTSARLPCSHLQSLQLISQVPFGFADSLKLCAESVSPPPVDLQLAWALKGGGAWRWVVTCLGKEVPEFPSTEGV